MTEQASIDGGLGLGMGKGKDQGFKMNVDLRTQVEAVAQR